MKITRLPCLWLGLLGIFLTGAGLRGAEAGIEFTGFVRDETGLSLALRNPANGDVKWVTLGQEFAGYTAKSLDEKAEILVVTKDKMEFHLPLIHSKVKQVDLEPSPEIKKQVLSNLRQLSAAADQFFLEHGTNHASYEDLVGETKYVRRLEPMDGEDYKAIKFEQGKLLEVTTSQGFVISYKP